ncbi:sporulation membrane protein YtaF [Carboxydothermus pertinax]|uniref:Sporulation membrane protein YtaF n=1 Tax=Carboxydothermus pertinax TaxID=870242 RepID=A0A1L8CXF8_9THEO|nr:sporulation membrane protein YtaF [Carboxydothermus pertinax]GAV23561.1 sporulation membrane protein YtaF [Carboxydothermus pertinax]
MELTLLLFSLALSLDGFGAGLAYGLRGLRVPVTSVVVVSVTSAFTIGFAMLLGKFINIFIPESFTRYLGAFLLVAIGIYVFFAGGSEIKKDSTQPKVVLSFKIFGLIFQILRAPQLADRDDSGVLSYKEAILLGIALALDAFGAGIGLSLSGYPILLTMANVGLVKFCLLALGLFLGKQNGKVSFIRNNSRYLASLVLIYLGISRIF